MDSRGAVALGLVMTILALIAAFEKRVQQPETAERPSLAHDETIVLGSGQRGETASPFEALNRTQDRTKDLFIEEASWIFPLLYLPPEASERGAVTNAESESVQSSLVTPKPQVSGSPVQGWATFYGPSFDGQCCLACVPGEPFRSSDPSIAASSWSEDHGLVYSCGQRLLLTGPAGSHIVTIQGACPGCDANVIDLSRAANQLVCGVPEHTCKVQIEVLK